MIPTDDKTSRVHLRAAQGHVPGDGVVQQVRGAGEDRRAATGGVHQEVPSRQMHGHLLR